MYRRVSEIQADAKSENPDNREFSPMGIHSTLNHSAPRAIGPSSRVSPSPLPNTEQTNSQLTTVYVQPKAITIQFDHTIAVGAEVLRSDPSALSNRMTYASTSKSPEKLAGNLNTTSEGKSTSKPLTQPDSSPKKKSSTKKPWWCCG